MNITTLERARRQAMMNRGIAATNTRTYFCVSRHLPLSLDRIYDHNHVCSIGTLTLWARLCNCRCCVGTLAVVIDYGREYQNRTRNFEPDYYLLLVRTAEEDGVKQISFHPFAGVGSPACGEASRKHGHAGRSNEERSGVEQSRRTTSLVPVEAELPPRPTSSRICA